MKCFQQNLELGVTQSVLCAEGNLKRISATAMPLVITYFYLYSYLEPINFIGIMLLITGIGTIYLRETYLESEYKVETKLLPANDPSAYTSSFLNPQDND